MNLFVGPDASSRFAMMIGDVFGIVQQYVVARYQNVHLSVGKVYILKETNYSRKSLTS